MYHIEPVVDADRAIDKMAKEAEEAAAYARWSAEVVKAESEKLSANMLKALSGGDADTLIPTPGNFTSTQPVAELLCYLADAYAAPLFELLQDATKGINVKQRATAFQALVSKTYGDVYAEPSLKSKGEI